jgi:hypothetical protein
MHRQLTALLDLFEQINKSNDRGGAYKMPAETAGGTRRRAIPLFLRRSGIAAVQA